MRLKLLLGTTQWPKLGVPGDAGSLTSEPKSPDSLRVTAQLLFWNENHRLVEDKKGGSGDALVTGPPELRLGMAALWISTSTLGYCRTIKTSQGSSG